MPALNTPIAAGERLRTVGAPDDFRRVDSNEWTATGNSQEVAANGVTLLSTTVSTDNSLAAIRRAYNWLLFSMANPLSVRLLAKFHENVVSGITNFVAGVTDKTAAEMLADDGAGLPASWSGAVFYAVDGSPMLRCRSSVGTAYKETILNWPDNRNNFARDNVLASYVNQRQFEVETRAAGHDVLYVNFIIDKLLVAQHLLVPAGAELMGEVVAVKSGDGSANVQTVEVDSIEPNSQR